MADARDFHGFFRGFQVRRGQRSDVPFSVVGGDRVHGTGVETVRYAPGVRIFGETDGYLTRDPGTALTIMSADCVPVYVVDPDHSVVGLLHAGWRGTVGGILPNALRRMARQFGTKIRRVFVSLGPHARSCCYEVREDTARAFGKYPFALRALADRPGSFRLDLSAVLRSQAMGCGVLPKNFCVAPFCTVHDRRFHSYRRDKTRKRMCALIMKGIGHEKKG